MSLWGGQRVPSDPRGHPKVPIPIFSGFKNLQNRVPPRGRLEPIKFKSFNI